MVGAEGFELATDVFGNLVIPTRLAINTAWIEKIYNLSPLASSFPVFSYSLHLRGFSYLSYHKRLDPFSPSRQPRLERAECLYKRFRVLRHAQRQTRRVVGRFCAIER